MGRQTVVCMCSGNAPLFRAPPFTQGCEVDQTPWAFSGFQISVTDYPAISGLCLFDFLYRLKTIPNQTSFIDETTQPPGPWINTTTWLVVYAVVVGGNDTNLFSKSLRISSRLNAPLWFPIRDLYRNYL